VTHSNHRVTLYREFYGVIKIHNSRPLLLKAEGKTVLALAY